MIRALKIKKSLLFILVVSFCLVPDNYSQSQNFSWEALENQIQEEVNTHLQNLQEKTLEEQRAILETMDPKHVELMMKYFHSAIVKGTLIEERIYNMNPDEERLSNNHNSLQFHDDLPHPATPGEFGGPNTIIDPAPLTEPFPSIPQIDSPGPTFPPSPNPDSFKFQFFPSTDHPPLDRFNINIEGIEAYDLSRSRMHLRIEDFLKQESKSSDFEKSLNNGSLEFRIKNFVHSMMGIPPPVDIDVDIHFGDRTNDIDITINPPAPPPPPPPTPPPPPPSPPPQRPKRPEGFEHPIPGFNLNQQGVIRNFSSSLPPSPFSYTYENQILLEEQLFHFDDFQFDDDPNSSYTLPEPNLDQNFEDQFFPIE